jgi:Chromo (CHRromatin Organisation MOdifier) domain
MKMYLVFHVSLLKKTPQDLPLCRVVAVKSDDDEYEVEKILDMIKPKPEKKKYLVKWKEYSDTESL